MLRLARALCCCVIALAIPAASASADAPAAVDNCTLHANDQTDSDLDGFGDRCDADFNNDGVVGIPDFLEIIPLLGLSDGSPSYDPKYDMNSDGAIGIPDFVLFRPFLGNLPGPSALPCAGVTTPCVAQQQAGALPTVQVYDAAPRNGVFDQYDVDEALTACGSGCLLAFLPVTYDDVGILLGSYPAGIELIGFGPGFTTLRSPLFAALGQTWQPVIGIDGFAPDDIVISDMTIDGRKSEQVVAVKTSGEPNTANLSRHNGVYMFPDGFTNLRGKVSNVEAIEFVTSGISLYGGEEWLVENNDAREHGCHQTDSPCGDALTPPNPWDSAPDLVLTNMATIPGLKWSGFGINVQDGSSDAIVRDNTVDNATKHGIEVFGGACGSGNPSNNVMVENNTVTFSRDGIVLNGGCGAQVIDNTATDSRSTGGAAVNVGNGFGCGADSQVAVWNGNTSMRNQRAGFDLGCFLTSGIDFIDNTSTDNCQNTTSGAAELFFDGDTPGAVTDLEIDNFQATGGQCDWGIRMRNRDAVTIINSSVEVDDGIGIEIIDSTNIDVRDTSFTATGTGSSAVVFAYETLGVMDEVYIQNTTSFTGFSPDVSYTGANVGTHGVDDGDSVARCDLETVPPAGCIP